MTARHAARLAGLALCVGVLAGPTARAAEGDTPVKPAITGEAKAAVARMGETLLVKELSFTAKTIRVYQDGAGRPLHTFHRIKVAVRRPYHFAAHVTGDDGSHDLIYDGESIVVFSPDHNEYTSIPATGGIRAALDRVDQVNPYFPLLGFFTEAPAGAFLSGVTAGWQVGTEKVDGIECRHLYFSRGAGIDIELWLEKNDAAIPHRMIVSYRLLPGRPSFIAELANWDVTAHRSDRDFTFHPPAGAKKVAAG